MNAQNEATADGRMNEMTKRSHGELGGLAAGLQWLLPFR
jgi:hypothetical protein